MKYNAEIKEVNTDRGTQFYSTKKNPSTFGVYVKSQGMKFIRKACGMNMISTDFLLEAFSRIFVGFVYENEWVVI